MRRFLRILLGVATMLSLATFVVAVALWVRTRESGETWGRGGYDLGGGRAAFTSWIVDSHHGTLRAFRSRQSCLAAAGDWQEQNWKDNMRASEGAFHARGPVGEIPFDDVRRAHVWGPFAWGETGSSGGVTPWRLRYVSVPLWTLAAASSGLPLLRLARLVGRRRAARRRRHMRLCPACGYDLRATPDRCPECGASAPQPARPGGAGG